MSEAQDVVPRVAPSAIHEAAPALGWYSDHLLFHLVWNRPGLPRRERSIVTVSALVTRNLTAQLTGHLNRALDHGVTAVEIVELVTHLAFYAGWPCAMSAIKVVREVFEQRGIAFATVGQSLPESESESESEPAAAEAASSAGPVAALLDACMATAVDGLWRRTELAPRDRALATVVAAIAAGQWGQLAAAAEAGLGEGLTGEELAEAVAHLGFYLGLPQARSAATVLDALPAFSPN